MNSFKIFLLILFVGFGLGACQNFLTPELDNQYGKDRFSKDPAWAWGLLVNAYASSTAFPSGFPLDEVATDDAVSNDVANTYLRMATGEWSSLFDPTSVWSSSYTAIVNINYFLSIVDGVEWSWQDTIRNRLFKNRFKGEAYAFRGYYYMQLLQRCGGIASDGTLMGVPIANGVITPSSDWKIQRATFLETFNQAAADLAAGITLLPYMYTDIANATLPKDVSWNRVNGTGLTANLIDGRHVRAMKARLMLIAASPAFNGGTNYDLVKADSVVQITGKLLTANGGIAGLGADPIFWDADADITNTDILWRNDYGASNTLEANNYPPSLYGSGRVNPTQNLVDAFPMKNGLPITDVTSGYDPQNPYLNRDPRLNMCILYNGGKERITGTLGSNNIINTQADNALDNDGLNKLALFSTRTGYYLKKLLRVDVNMTTGSTTTQRHFYARLRWTEMYLNYAEAANEVYGPDVAPPAFAFTARQIISAIRKRGAGATLGGITQPDAYLATVTTAAGMRALIRNERRLELCFEGFRFWDIRRWNVPLSQLKAAALGVSITGTTPVVYNYTGAGVNPVENRVYLQHMYYGPIPYLETKKYPGFLQNKGW